jgi:rRNA maturation protein Nop10
MNVFFGCDCLTNNVVKGLVVKHVAVSTGLHDADIRPPSILSEFIQLSIQDAEKRFDDPSALVEINCPACDHAESENVFDKQGFHYKKCTSCGSVYVSARPSQQALDDYYAESEASQYRVERFSKETREARRVHMLRAMANWMCRLVDEKGSPEVVSYGDWGSTSPLIFEEIQALDLFSSFSAIDPLPGLDHDLTEMGINIDAAESLDALSCFELLEHRFSPQKTLVQARESLKAGGLLFLTTRTISGFDLQVLWDKAPYIFVPEHLNLMSVEGLSQLLERCGFEIIELSTPGQLDIELVQQAVRFDPEIPLPGFVRNLLENRDARAHEDFQSYLQKHRLSSHVRIAARRQEG